ncbi:ribbon-helix-helix protein, CopG family [Mycobacterium sp. M1]|uniref:Ribbon-helix-helix protein, CopG family n=1 Tax=Mycolicibacter acidiphilus TaxID=2835306 RepID=A0ABS5RP44_9MYCO|nr:ribbon-helix-helix domain-containing protein [Mycolicibacter acidiphilus]MBS9536062.1 ribbon-helix-helix protein, CopG family [Mycolicibacter acidiphilus]
MKLSISLSDEDVAALDEYAERAGLQSRSAAVRHAIHALRHPGLEDDYDRAWSDWSSGGDAEIWDQAASDGIADAPR